MPAPRPLTQCDPANLDWSRKATPAAQDFDDIYFSIDGGIEESRTVFLGGCDLPNAWTETEYFSIGELGFGTGLNFLATWQMWDLKAQGGHLDFVSIEKFPLSKQQLIRALAHFPELNAFAARLIELWPDRTRGLHRLELSPSVTLTLIHDDITPALSALDHKFDAWFLDGFSPEKNPDMWSEKVTNKIAALSKTGTRLATFSVAGTVRNALIQAGFSVFKKKGFSRKRHRLEAVFDGPSRTFRACSTPKTPLIIGGGIAGASVCRAFLRAGIVPTLIEASNTYQTAASGNAAAIIKPRFDLQDRPESRFFLSSFLYARAAYLTTEHVLHTGVTHLTKDEKETRRFEKLITQAPLGEGHLEMSETGFSMPSSLVIAPKPILENWTHGANQIIAKVSRIEKSVSETGNTYTLYDTDNCKIASGDALIMCAGADIPAFKIDGLENLRFSRGQLSWAETMPSVQTPVTYGSYAIPLKNATLIGATHARLTSRDPHLPVQEDDIDNFEKFERATSKAVTPLSIQSRASIRVTTQNTLPYVDQIDKDFWVLTGLGSRGFVFAPLLGTHIVSAITGGVSPLTKQQEDKFKISSKA